MSVVLLVLVVMTLFLVGLRPTLRCGVVDGAICSLLLYLLPWWGGCGAFCLFMANPQTFLFRFALLSMPARATLTIPGHKCMSAKQIPCQVGPAKQAITGITIAVPCQLWCVPGSIPGHVTSAKQTPAKFISITKYCNYFSE